MKKIIILSLVFTIFTSATLLAKDVNITADIKSVDVTHDKKTVTIMRNQNVDNTINETYAKTSRHCPPFCVQPMTVAPGVETIGELELLDYLKAMSAGDDSIVLVDSRTKDSFEKSTIPGAINVPWTLINIDSGANPIAITDILINTYNVSTHDDLLDFSTAKTAILFCNGMWCPQSPNNIRSLIQFGYPANNIKWYRGGMQAWETLGLTTIKP